MDRLEVEFYKLLVEEVREARKARRDIANLFITLNLGGAAGLGYLVSEKDFFPPLIAVLLAVALIVTALVWSASNGYYKQMLAAKYAVLYDVESKLGVDYIRREWALMKPKRAMRWFTLERAMPTLFIVCYAIFLLHLFSWADVEGAIDAARAALSDRFGG